jgi:solute carrier family 25 S-adenosylmethionine transporter 26
MRDLPFAALQFPLLEHIKKALLTRSKSQKQENASDTRVHLFEHIKIATLSGSIAGSATAWVTTPADIVKTRLILEANYNNRNQQSRVDIPSTGSRIQCQITKK